MTAKTTPAIQTNAEVQAPDWAALAAERETPCISVYLPLGSGAAAAKPEFAQIRRLLQTSQASFEGAPVTAAEAEVLLSSQWHRVLESQPVHGGGAAGLVLFLSGGFFACYQLPASFPARVVIGREFYIRPLLHLVSADDQFLILAASQKHVRFFRCSRYGIHGLTLERIPELLRQDLETHSIEKQIQFHSGTPSLPGKKGVVFYGSEPDPKDRILRFFRDIDQKVKGSLKGQHAPLVVAAVDYLFPIYKTANTYPHLLETSIGGNPDLTTPEALHAAAWKVVEKHLEEAKDRSFGVYKDHINTDSTSSSLRKVLPSAQEGRVRFLFVPEETEHWGSLVPPETVHVHGKRENGDAELLNLASVLTIRGGGQVYIVAQNQLPEGAELAAAFRY
ncbi:MAG TPA: hypothetical protein VN822_06560 [Candidatus Acidoferrales bacterium]|nr:hypothetical protein [Candidatus Acidoferrales bacterium]